jgi:preprotein translocase subunit SecD
MSRKLLLRVLFVLVLIALSLWSLYPPGERLTLGTDLQGGVQLVLRVRTDEADPARRDEIIGDALQIIERRVNELGVSEPVVTTYGDDRILVELAGVRDVDGAKRIIRSTAQLRLTLVDQGPFPTEAAARAAYGGSIPAELELLAARTGGDDAGETPYWVVARQAVVAGPDVRDARQAADEFGRPAVAFTLTPDAGRRFGDFTGRNVNRAMATVLDGRVSAVATIISRIDDQGQIVGLSRDEMLEQVINLRSGALPADLDYVEERMVSASLGRDSVRAGIAASVGGLVLVAAFMLAYYRFMGLNAIVSISLNLLFLMAFAALVPVTLTLPGIAGLLLTIGMGVDSNVLIFERIKEELAAGKASGVRAAFDRVWTTIVDTHVASLIAAALLYVFGTSAIRGFATMLAAGLLINVFTAVFVSRTMFELTALRRRT